MSSSRQNIVRLVTRAAIEKLGELPESHRPELCRFLASINEPTEAEQLEITAAAIEHANQSQTLLLELLK